MFNSSMIINTKLSHNVLWLSRHPMTEDQERDLLDICGEKTTIKHVQLTARTCQEIVEAGADCDILAVVLPEGLMSELLNPENNTKPVLRAHSHRKPTGKKIINPATGAEEDERMFVHDYWELVEQYDIKTRRLTKSK